MTVEGHVKLVQVGSSAGPFAGGRALRQAGGIGLLFVGRTHFPGIVPGAVLRAAGRVGEFRGHLALANPRWELIERAPV